VTQYKVIEVIEVIEVIKVTAAGSAIRVWSEHKSGAGFGDAAAMLHELPMSL